MKLKRYALGVLILGDVLLFTGIITPIICAKIYITQHGAIGIIGGADGPTTYFLAWELLNGWPVVFGLLGVSLIISAAFCLLFSRTVIAHCNITTSLISLGLSGIGALGLTCACFWIAIALFDKIPKPAAYPVNILLGISCILAFVALPILYFKERKEKRSIKGVMIDFLTCIAYFPAFFYAFQCFLEQILSC